MKKENFFQRYLIMNSKQSRLSPKGFTLLEVLISVAILGAMGLLIAITLQTTILAKNRVDTSSSHYNQIRSTLNRMAREIAMAYLSDHENPTSPIVVTQFKGTSSSLYFNAFGNVVRTQNSKQSDQRVLGYYLGTDKKTGEQALIRKENLYPGNNVMEGGIEQTLCQHVVGMELHYWSEKSADGWVTDWDTDNPVTFGGKEGESSRKRLPLKVKIKLTTKLPGFKEETFITQTQIWLTNPIKIAM